MSHKQLKLDVERPIKVVQKLLEKLPFRLELDSRQLHLMNVKQPVPLALPFQNLLPNQFFRNPVGRALAHTKQVWFSIPSLNLLRLAPTSKTTWNT